MDINCTHSCIYQHEGKCSLQKLPAMTAASKAEYSNEVDCPYYAGVNA